MNLDIFILTKLGDSHTISGYFDTDKVRRADLMKFKAVRGIETVDIQCITDIDGTREYEYKLKED